MASLSIGDERLTIDDVVEVARGYRAVVLGDHARRRIDLCRAVVDKLIQEKVKVYGLTTGFASKRDVFVEDSKTLSRNLIRSHSAGVGEAVAEDVVRAAMLLRAQALAQGNSGVTAGLVEVLIALLNGRIYPYIPEHGSVGCSGDLAPLSHLALVLIGDPLGRVHRRILGGEEPPPRAEDQDFVDHVSMRRADSEYIARPRRADFVRIGTAESSVRAGLATSLSGHLEGTPWPHDLQAKEGLASNNGTVVTTAALALAVYDSVRLLDTAELATALSFEALQSVLDPLEPGVLRARPHPGHAVSANNIQRALVDSQLVGRHTPCGVNMSMFNRTMFRLHAARSKAQGADETRIQSLWSAMERRQETLWAEVEVERERVLASELDEASAYPKALELRACRRALGIDLDGDDGTGSGALDLSWRASIGWANPRTGDDRADDRTRDDARLEQPEQLEVITRAYLELFSKIVRRIDDPRVQDNYSFRGAATVLGACRETCTQARRVAEVECNSTTDNPLILLDDILEAAGIDERAEGDLVGELDTWLDGPCKSAGGFTSKGDGRLRNWALAADAVRSAANFHGEPVGIAADHLALAMAEVGALAERRCAGLTDAVHSNGLPSFLVWEPGLNSGLLITQYCAASIVSENKLLAFPASVDSISTGENTEDHNSMSFLAARKAAKIVENSEYLVAIELLTAYQGVQFRKPARLGVLTRKVEDLLHARLAGHFEDGSGVPLEVALASLGLGRAACESIRACVLDDVVLAPAMDAVADLVRRGEISAIMPPQRGGVQVPP